MTTTIHNVVTLVPVTSETTQARDDTGIATQTLRLSGYTNRASATLAAAREIVRQLREMASNVNYRVVYVADDEDATLNGLYELLEASETASPRLTNAAARLYDISVTLRRVGGGGLYGSNMMHLVAAKSTLIVNDYSVTALTYMPIPVGGTFVPTTVTGGATRTGSDGAMSLIDTGTLQQYVFAGADQNTGECQVWDTGGSAVEADWKRVWSADHTFANLTYCVIENSLVRFRASASTVGRHEVDVWNTSTSGWTAVTDTSGDLVTMTTSRGIEIVALSPWLVIVTFQCVSSAATLVTKTITLERGKHTAKVRLAANSATAFTIGLRHDGRWRWLWARNTTAVAPAIDAGVEANTTLSRSDAFACLFSNTVNVQGLLGVANSTVIITRNGGGVVATQTTVALEVSLGGVAYDATDGWAEAETEALGGGATAVSTIAGASGTTNTQVRLGAAGAAVNFSTLAQINASAPGTRVIALVRVASTVAAASANAGDTLAIVIYNNTTALTAASVGLLATNATYFATANTWVWVGLEFTTWNGTDSLFPYAVKSGSVTAQAFHIDQALFFTENGGPGVNRPRDVAHQALTDVVVFEQAVRVL